MSVIVSYTGPNTRNDAQMQLQTAARSSAYDPVDKLRVSTPQSLIDTDFEYGQQPTKWEQVAFQNNRQSLYYLGNAALPVSAIAGNQANLYQLVITFSSNVTIATGSPIFIEDTLDPNAQGWGYVFTGVTGGTSITVQMAQQITTATCWSATMTYVYLGYTYSGSGIALSNTSAFTNVGAVITCTSQFPHGLSAGSYIYITGTTGPTAATSINGPQIVATTPTANTFTFTNVGGTPSASVVNATGQANLFARPAGWVDTHAYDGSVNFTAGASVPNQQLIRQTRRYFRYQSGKGIQFSTGTIMKPQLVFTSLTSSGTTVTVTSKVPHNMTAGAYVQVVGFDQAAYNGIFKIVSVPSVLTFTYTALTAPGVSPATSTAPTIPHVSPYSWYGSSNKIGFFDAQNGVFFQFDGQTIYCVLRSSVNQITGTASVTQGSSLVTGSSTQFSTQLVVGDYVVIRGQSHRVASITSDTQMYITPEYRGTTIANLLVSRTIDIKIPQSQWWDVCDGSNSGSNPSGYNLDLTKIQMFYIDYSWYGAGVARFGFRSVGGSIIYVYGFQNNNVQYQAYMRSGNLPSHYEQNNVTPMTMLSSSVGVSDTTINVASTAGFNPAGGTARIIGNGVSGAIEYIAYTGMTSTALTGVTRGQTGGAVATAFTYSATAPIAVEYTTPDTAAMLSHWGSSVVMDGGFNNDVSLIYNYGMTSTVSTTSSTPVPIMAIRVAPSVDNGTTGTLGVKEIVNRLQLQMREIALLTTTSYLVQFILNGVTTGFSANFQSPNQNNTNTTSIVQVATNTSAAATITGGESIAAFFTNTTGQTTLDLEAVAPFGNSAIGGGTSNAVPNSQTGTYPDGPDILYVVITQIGANGTALARLSWQESQA
ncbi:hypothetical protein UFOVP239_69 [uncultured Caudovirales phage]|uniref:Uncharacterized protein n=1 Tax=uncultured Caudovirales phage TaxID=2100421 RepID=A0A6J7WVK6_9CAUD|nr:hypothetical protein UFOVP239_69 [uncultured Caudovirales phage]